MNPLKAYSFIIATSVAVALLAGIPLDSVLAFTIYFVLGVIAEYTRPNK